MGTTTRLVLEQRFSEAIGDYESLTASAGNTTTLTAAALADLTEDNDGIQGWVKIDAGSAAGDIRRIKASSGYVASTKVLTVNRAFSASAGAVAFTLHRYDPKQKLNAISRAIELLFPTLYLPVRDETLSVDNLLINSSFEKTGTAGEDWTLVAGSFSGETTVSASDGLTRSWYYSKA